MKAKVIIVFCVILVVFFLGRLCAVCQEGPLQERVPKQPIPRIGPDLAADIQIDVLSKETEARGNIRIVGVVKNVGNRNYVSKLTQQSVALYMTDATGSTITNTLTWKNFGSPLRAGQAVRLLLYSTSWDTSQGSLPCFRLVITFDPDIASDGNPANDDVNANNNTTILCGAEISNLFRNQDQIRDIDVIVKPMQKMNR